MLSRLSRLAFGDQQLYEVTNYTDGRNLTEDFDLEAQSLDICTVWKTPDMYFLGQGYGACYY
jgi:hypothetical protein